MDSTNVYAYISIIALIVCIPPAIIVSRTSTESSLKVINVIKLINVVEWSHCAPIPSFYRSKDLNWLSMALTMELQKLALSSLSQISSGWECFTIFTIRYGVASASPMGSYSSSSGTYIEVRPSKQQKSSEKYFTFITSHFDVCLALVY